jgi:hypothetical protein
LIHVFTEHISSEEHDCLRGPVDGEFSKGIHG